MHSLARSLAAAPAGSHSQVKASSSSSSLAGAADAGVARRRHNSTHQQRHHTCCHAIDPLLELAVTDPAALQDVIVGGAVTAAVGAALYSGLKQEPVPCDLCAGNGGIKCFACSGAGSSSSGSMELIDPDILQQQQGQGGGSRKLARGFTSGSSSSRPGSCRVCKGKGLVLCSKCKGTGYMSTF